MFRIILLLFALIASPAAAQNTTCADRPIGNSTNACANTRFVQQNVTQSPLQVFYPETYGAGCGNIVADSTTAFISMITAINSATRGKIELNPACTGATAYILYPSVTPPSTNALPDLTGLTELIVNCNGATIDVPYNFSGHANTVVYLFTFRLSRNITFNDCVFDQSTYRNKGDSTNGTTAISIGNGVTNVVVDNFYQRGGRAGFLCARAANEARSQQMRVSVVTENVYYPFSLAKTCDNSQALIHATNPGRAFFVYNVASVTAQIFSTNADGPQDVLISNSYDSTDTAGGNQSIITANITVDYTNFSSGTVGAGLNAFMTIVFQTGVVEGPAVIENIDATLKINASGSQGTGPILTVLNQTTSAQSRWLRNVTIRGSSSMTTPSGNIMELMRDKDWTGLALVSNLNIGPFYISQPSGAFQVDGRAINGPYSLSSVWGSESGGGISYSGTNMTGKGGLFIYDRVYLPTLIASPAP